jgi:methionyl-tRNA formyltransferase
VKLVFLGTAEFAVAALRLCAERHNVIAVVTQPDSPGSRGAPAPRPVKRAAEDLGLRVLQPERIREASAMDQVLAGEPDCLVVAAYGQILPAPLLEGPRHGAVNVHASLLPRWRGASPVAHAILAGDAATGVSIMKMDRGLDTGPVYATRSVAIPADATTPALTATLADLGADLLLQVLRAIESGGAVAVEQDDADATRAPRLTRADAAVDWAASTAVEVDRHVRALQPWPGTLALLQGVEVRLLAGRPVDAASAEPGSVVATLDESVVVAARVGAYRVDRVGPPGSRPMTAAAFLRGRR